MAMQQRSRNAALTGLLQARVMWSVINLPTGVIRRSSSLVHNAVGLAEGALGALSDLAKNTGATGGFVVQQAIQGGRLLLDAGGIGRGQSRAPPVRRTFAGSMEAMTFVRNFDMEFGHGRPDFEKSSFVEAVSRAVQDYKLMFAYLHSSENAGSLEFCRRTLCSQEVVEFVNANFVSWGADVRSSEGFQMSISLRAPGFPFCAVVGASSPQHLLVLQQVNGQMSGLELISTLRRVLKQHGGALSVARSEQAEIAKYRRLRDAAANQALLVQARSPQQRVHDKKASDSEESNNKKKSVAPAPRRRKWFFLKS
ncbi:plant UBX domain-containing protein 10 [Selaginella moellendorffii]|uniref:plant UBX domain-containing protein 10 n=1 Tax=Selaginella moellendorffii TaxID=88036 RepID=UPI000D1CB5AE|nr:plant UBX domain-containing protein 10 [Selaginella moellendorffii]|eukprot:XP_002973602.2 plant UBX domain-containing protein 10 [Selaginella moellendorffii]